MEPPTLQSTALQSTRFSARRRTEIAALEAVKAQEIIDCTDELRYADEAWYLALRSRCSAAGVLDSGAWSRPAVRDVQIRPPLGQTHVALTAGTMFMFKLRARRILSQFITGFWAARATAVCIRGVSRI